MAQGLIVKMLDVPEGATKEQVAGEIDKLLEDETVKAATGKFHIDNRRLSVAPVGAVTKQPPCALSPGNLMEV